MLLYLVLAFNVELALDVDVRSVTFEAEILCCKELDGKVKLDSIGSRLFLCREISCRLEYPASRAIELCSVQHHGCIHLLKVESDLLHISEAT